MMISIHRAFTLIELLIVVAIIAILAASAVPNFMEAQVRAKVSRSVADISTVATALETYAVDHGYYPEYGNATDHLNVMGRVVRYLPHRLTTPVSYLSALPESVFQDPATEAIGVKDPLTLRYINNRESNYLGVYLAAGHVQHHYQRLTGSDRAVEWTIWNVGPDLVSDHGIILYDPTNGTTSRGDKMRFGP